jgi:HEAT repeat protein
MPLIKRPAAGTEIPAPDSPNIAVALLEGSDDERWTAARSASEIPDNISLLSNALSREGVPRVREAIFTALAKIGTAESAAVVLPHLRSDDAARRTGALDALRAMAPAAGAHLPLLLSDADPDVRLLACELARNLPADEASRTLGALIEREENANVCAAAIEVLAETGDAAILPALSACAARFPNDPFLGFAADLASRRIGSR